MTDDQPSGALTIRLRYETDEIVVSITGDFNRETAEQFTSMFDTFVENHRTKVVIDVAALRYMDAAGLAAIAVTSTRLAEHDIAMSLRAVQSASGPNNTRPTSTTARLPGTDDNTRRVAGAGRPLPGAARGVGVIDATLRGIAVLATATLDNAFGVSVTLERDGQPATVAASNDAVLRLDEHQYETGEGPCLSAKADNHRYYIESLDDEQRWPAFVPLALGHGVHSILSSPLVTVDRAVGSLNIYSLTQHAFDDHDQELAELLAVVATDVLATGPSNLSDEQHRRRWADGLADRQTVTLAQGMLMHQHRLTVAGAAAHLHDSSRAARLTVLQYATQLLSPYNSDDPGRVGP